MGQAYDSDDESTTDVSETGRDLEEKKVEEARRRQRELLVGKETKVIVRFQRMVFAFLAVIALACSLSTFYILENEKILDLEDQFRQEADEFFQETRSSISSSFSLLRSLASTITVTATSTKSEFPNVTLPLFEELGTDIIDSSDFNLILYAPLVESSKLEKWEEYSIQKQDEDIRISAINPKVDVFDRTYESPAHHLVNGELPIWQVAPRSKTSATSINQNLRQKVEMEHVAVDVTSSFKPVLSGASDLGFITDNYVDRTESNLSSYLLEPIFVNLKTGSAVKGLLLGTFSWEAAFQNRIGPTATVKVVVDDGCGQVFTYAVKGSESQFLGTGDLHEAEKEELVQKFHFMEDYRFTRGNVPHPPVNGLTYDEYYKDTPMGHCAYTVKIYPTAAYFSDLADQEGSLLFALSVFAIFAILFALLFMYDVLVARRQRNLLQKATRTYEIVSSMFPQNVQSRMLQLTQPGKEGSEVTADTDACSVIADLYPEATVVFADIVGFTAWSSTREPHQVFRLLEQVYNQFDRLACRQKVFKIETIGDCYVAVAGLPDPQPDHAVAASKFAAKSIKVFSRTVRSLEVELGPDTGDLALRVGVHSGPVTSGVLRGERARYQLFGDTVNTTARIESTGKANRVHLSADTAALLTKAGHDTWIVPREDSVRPKGKGEMQTYFLAIKASSVAGSVQSLTSVSNVEKDGSQASEYYKLMSSAKKRRLIAWNTDTMIQLLKEVIRSRGKKSTRASVPFSAEALSLDESLPIEEVSQVLELPDRDDVLYIDGSVEIGENVRNELHEYVKDVANMYNNNPFHNFEHASHVAMSVSKLLSRIVTPSQPQREEMKQELLDPFGSLSLSDYSYGITSDPLTQFACFFSALIHDCDHFGVSNQRLIEEQHVLVDVFGERSVAEQHSIDIAWDHLMSEKFENFRNVLLPDLDTGKRFRQLVVNGVMATDIMDKGLKEARNKRWAITFADNAMVGDRAPESPRDVRNRKATIVIDHIIQASDVSHTMQHWHIYRKWNERLFLEMVKAFEEGRSAKHPVEFWYKGEIGFFDFYIIPLAKKLKECRVFGVSSAEYLDYAEKNRDEWVKRGEEAVAKMMSDLEMRKKKIAVESEIPTTVPESPSPMTKQEHVLASPIATNSPIDC